MDNTPAEDKASMRFPTLLSWYQKPEYRDIKEFSSSIVAGHRCLTPEGRSTKSKVPSSLSLDRVLANRTCSPMSLYDFYMYLKYIEFSEENLEFLVWFRNYEIAWKAAERAEIAVPAPVFSSSPLPPQPKNPSEASLLNEKRADLSDVSSAETRSITASVHSELSDKTVQTIVQLIPGTAACTSSKAYYGRGRPVVPIVHTAVVSSRPASYAYAPKGNPAASDAPLSTDAPAFLASAPEASGLDSSTASLESVIRMYLMPGANKELNIPHWLRQNALTSLRDSADPDHLRPVAEHVYGLIRNCSHRNFVRLGVSNGTTETICVATTLGIVLCIAGVLLNLLRACVPHVGAHSRWNAVAAWPLWFIGLGLVFSGLRGSCFFLLLFSRRQPLPWERFDDDDSEPPAAAADSTYSRKRRSTLPAAFQVLSRLMIFDRKLRIKDANLRRLQHKIVVQSLVSGCLISTLAVLVFNFLPIWSQNVSHRL